MTLIKHPDRFKEGVRILMRVLRTKDGGKGNVDRHAKKLISRDPEEFDICLERLLHDIEPGERVYSTVDARDTGKAIRTFKQLQLDNDYSPTPQDFYLDMHNRWVSALQQPSARAESLFLWDCDTDKQFADVVHMLECSYLPELVYTYETKNGGHVITRPFNYTILEAFYRDLVKKNAMMLWSF